jgi:phage protein U
MLYSLGPLVFEVAPFNTHEVKRTASADFAAKDLLGRRKSHEFVGDGDEKIELRGKLFPQKLGGLDGLAMLEGLRASGTPYMLMRGDGTPLGWFLVERVQEQSSHHDAKGVGRLIEFEIELVRDDAPSPANFLASLFTLFG